jgi:hypothetical protein
VRWATVAAFVLVGSITTRAIAHVAPSVDDNNRYLKITPQADRIRVAYTVFFGEVPGQALRPSLDTDRNGTISDAEGDAYGARVAADVIGSLELAIDGRAQRFAWKQVSVGLGSPNVTNAGSFSIDMIAYVCLPTVGGKHDVVLRDRFRVPKPGETEVRVEDGPGITVSLAKIAGGDALSNDFKFVGPGGPLSDEGLHVVFTAADNAPREGCSGATIASAPKPSNPPWIAIGIGALVLLCTGVLFVIRRRR